jgi:6-phosphogluconate dehydrogenase
MTQLGIIGLGTMGANLARNAARNGAEVFVYNRTAEKTDAFMKDYASEGNFIATKSYEELTGAFADTKVILIMVKAGEAVDAVITDLLPLLAKGDVVIDGGNSHYKDTNRRVLELQEKGIHFIGMGVSGGEEGALHGPSMMPGGSREGFSIIEPLLQKMAAEDGLGGKCITYVGEGGAGHFVKMVHNGIEYGVMQLIAESYDVLKSIGAYKNEELAETFAYWNDGEDLNSFLMEISSKIFLKVDDDTGANLIDLIQDRAGQKGTGKWTTEAALDLGVALPTINAAVDARILSGSVDVRNRQSGNPVRIDLEEPIPPPQKLRNIVRSSLHLSSMTTYAQGFELIKAAAEEYKWSVQLSECARVWLGGCIIRSTLLKTFTNAFSPDSSRKKDATRYANSIFGGEKQVDWRLLIQVASSRGIPVPSMYASQVYYDSLRRERLPQNLIQAQRDFFGAHTYERVDKKGLFHTEWLNSSK